MDQICECVDSTPSPAALAAVLASRYDLGESLACELIQQNLDASYLWMTPRGQYIARVHNSRWWSMGEVEYEMAVLAHLAGRGLRVPRPLLTRDGAPLTALQAPEGPRQLTVVEYLSGRDFAPYRDARDYGTLVARVHAEMVDFDSEHAKRGPTLENLLEDAFEPVLEQTHRGGELHDYFASLKERIRLRADHLGIPQFPRCFCHGDLNFANCVRGDDGSVGVFDFECCGLGLRAYDLAVFRWTQKLVGIDDDIWKSFVQGYGAVSEHELAAIDLLALLRQAWMIGHDARRTALQLLGTSWCRLDRPRNYDNLKRLDADVFGIPALV